MATSQLRLAVSAASPIRGRRARRRVARTAAYVAIVLGAAVVFFPLYWQIATSLKAPGDVFRWPPRWLPIPPHPENYLVVARTVPLALYVRNSAILTASAIVGTLLSCSLAAYAFARLRFPWRDAIFLVLISPMILPWSVVLIPQFVGFYRLGLYNTYWPLIVPHFLGANAFFIFLLRQFFLTIPMELEDAARVDGAGHVATFVRIILPLSKSALATVAIFRFMWSWNDFFGPLIYLSDGQLFTLPLALAFFQGSPESPVQMHLLMAMAVVIAVPCVVVFFFAQRLFIQGIVFTGIKG